MIFKKSLLTHNLLLITILIIASFLRLYNLTELPPGLYPDEAMNGNNAQEALDTAPPAGGLKIFYPENFGREGLFINIQALFIRQFGHEPWVLRLPSAIFGILTVLGLYFLTKELLKHRNLALLAAFLMATSFWHINFSRIGFRAIMAPFFLTWAMYFLLKSLNAKRYMPYAMVSGLLYGLGFYSYIAYRATPPLLIFIFWMLAFRYGWNNVVRVGAIFITVAILTAAPLGIYFWQNPQDFFGRAVGISIFNSETLLHDLTWNTIKTLGMFNVAGDFNWRQNIAGRPELFWPVGIMFLVGLYIAIKNLAQSVKLKIQNYNSKFKNIPPEADTQIFHFSFFILIFWLLFAALPVVVSNEGLPHALRSLLMAPPVFILSAIGGLKIYEFLKSKFNDYWLLIICYLFLSLLLFESYVTYFVTWGRNPNVKPAFAYNDYIIAKQLNQLPKELPKYVILNEKIGGTIERDNPISLQTILFLTDTFTNEKRKDKNLIYTTKEEIKSIKLPANGLLINL